MDLNIILAGATVGSLVVATLSLISAIRQSTTRKYEMRRNYYGEVLAWYSETLGITNRLKSGLRSGEIASAEKRSLLAELSTRIDIGRFYFPNMEDDYGKHKPAAFRGLRNITLDYLVLIHDVFEGKTGKDHLRLVDTLQRKFTSCVFEILNPQSHISELKRITSFHYYRNGTAREMIEEVELLLNNLPRTEATGREGVE